MPSRDPARTDRESCTCVLIVGNGLQTGRSLQRAARDGDLIISAVPDVRQAVHRLRDQSFDAVVIELPVGGRMAELIENAVEQMDPDHRDRLIFLVADLVDAPVRRLLMRAGRPFLTRPVDGAELTELVRRVARAEG